MSLLSPLWVRRRRENKPLLVLFTGATVAYSLRDLTGRDPNVIRVRRSGDNAESDFTATQILSGNLTAFCVAGGGTTSGFVTTWYDQSGNGRNAIQATAGNQPRIVNAGVLETEGGKPAVRWLNTAEQRLVHTDTNALDSFRLGAQSSFAVARLTERNASWQAVWMPTDTSGNKNGSIGQQFCANSTGVFGNHNTNQTDTRPAPVTLANALNRYLFTMFRNGAGSAGNGATISQFAKNASDSQSATGVQRWASTTGGVGKLILGKQWDDNSAASVASWRGTMQEIILYSRDLSTQQAAIEANINSYYGVY